ncbi:helix-turn-helix domain-containing protein [Paraburkholderia youngii]|uniref:helix-turn-helix domain-containing protein n=1 Tax=Paraburkholderia youngii TaxID=2782701 RepID=UPI001591ECBD|nr:helix-turn-helix domain-containing protein [Paraburkholderia youngii]NUX55940.1 helix-turn-helix transcriptional regulator [Paraburkholderia youngii]
MSDVLRDIGRPVAYYPGLAKPLGGVKAAVLFCQIFYWHSRSQHELGVHKTAEELSEETGLSYEEQRAARKSLKKAGVLIETEKRLEHKIYFRIDEDALERVIETARAQASDSGSENDEFAEREKPTSPNGKSPFREVEKAHLAERSKPPPRCGESLDRGEGDDQVVNGVKTTAEITAESSSNACAREAVDTSAAAAADSKSEEPNAEAVLTELLVALERDRGKSLTVDRSRDRTHVLTWVGKGVSVEQLRAAHALAVAARKRDGDDRPTYAGFVAQFVDEVLAPPAGRSGDAAMADGGLPWYETPDGVDARGKEAGVRERKPEEDWRYYRVLVANTARDRAAVAFILKDAQRFNAVDLYQFARATFGDALMPVDDYAS